MVPLKTLDLILPSEIFDVVKIDVEGAEEGVLRGGDQFISRCRPTIMFESGPKEVLGYTKAGIWDWLHERDYGIYVPNRLAHTAPALSREGFLEAHHFPRRTTNYFAVPAEKRDDVRAQAYRLLRR